jgi:hypothetical protein
MSFERNRLVPLEKSDIPRFEKNDIIWISFTLAFVVGPDTWAPEYRPIDIIRVGRMPDGYGGRIDHSAIPEIGRKPLEAGTVTLPPPGKSANMYTEAARISSNIFCTARGPMQIDSNGRKRKRKNSEGSMGTMRGSPDGDAEDAEDSGGSSHRAKRVGKTKKLVK